MGVNLGVVERVIRVVIGAFLIAAGLLVVKSILGVAVVLFGAVLILSGFMGFCHVRKFFGIGKPKKT